MTLADISAIRPRPANLSMIFLPRFATHSALKRLAAGGILFAPPGRTALSNPPVISIIDDDESVRAATHNLVRSFGYIVHTFASAEEFLQSPHLNDTSCVIADVQMPAMSGVELQAHLLARGRRVPFIFVTAFSVESARARALKAGASGFLTKPFAGEALIRCIDAALEGRGELTSK
jgi:FixJ family two-component response regulator